MKSKLGWLKQLRIKNSTELLYLVCTVSFIVFLMVVFWGFEKEWASYQKDYKKISLKIANTEEEKTAIQEFEIGIKQNVIPALNRVDRCVSCHVSIDQKGFENIGQPLKTHPGTYLANHRVDKFGCTICHGGLGKATTSESAHGALEGEGTINPMYRGVFVQSSCGKCHNENSFVETSVLGMGKRLYELYGCNVCHKIYKSGGTPGPDLTIIGSKKYYDVDWGKNHKGEKNITEWLINHFLDPSHYYESKMMDFKMNDENAKALTVYMLSLVQEEIPKEYIFDKNNENK